MTDSDHKLALRLGEQLDEYRLVRVLGAGGFGVTYLAEHIRAGNRVAIKEYLPNELAVREGATVHPKSSADREGFAWGLARFLDEARTLARFEHRNVVRVQRYFEANNTAYLVMDYEDGASLGELLKDHGTLSEAQLRRVLMPIVDGLRAVHAAGFLHRDIKPDNIFVRRSDESPVLLDFGAARQALGHRSRSLTGVITAGYSPPEQYESDGNQGPWTDVYALSALCYKAITGSTPVDVLDRQREIFRNRRADPLPRLADNPPEGYSRSLLEAVDWGLRLSEEDRPQTLDDWLSRLDAPQDTGPAVPLSSREPSRRRGVSRWAAGGGLGAAAAVAAAVVFWFTAGPSREPQPAEQAGEQASRPAPAEPELQPGATDTSTPGEAVDLEGGSAILVVTTAPEGVEVVLDGRVLGRTPVELRDLRAGAYSVTLRHPDYETVRLDDQRLAGGRVLRIVQEMTRATGALTIITQPADAWIERDGERLAEGTPVTLENLPAGSARLVLGAHEHRSITVQVDVPKDGVAMLERTLAPIPYGTLTLELDPPDAAVTLPDVEPAYRAGMRLPEGEHRVTVRRAGYREMTQTVAVSGDTRTRIGLELNPQPFTVETTPAAATVEVVGSAQAYRPGIPLRFGEYRIRVTAPEYEALEETVTHGTEPTRHEVALVQLPQPFQIETTPAAAMVKLVGVGEEYRSGMRLAPGEYAVRVSAEGYVTREGTVSHGRSPTRIAVALEAVPQTFSDALASGGTGPQMVVIPAGSFRMGCVTGRNCEDDEHPVHEVTFSGPFALSVYEVTFADWAACTNAGGCNRHRPDDGGWGRGNRPVIDVSWEDAQSYISWLSRETGAVYRLPSESEWEYAARAGTVTSYSWGNEIGGNRANCNGCGSRWDDDRTAPVGSFAANPWGLHDMHGNVWEWVEDCGNDSYTSAPLDGNAWLQGSCAQRVLRGGSWNYNPRYLRAANRRSYSTDFRYSIFGFRVARTLPP